MGGRRVDTLVVEEEEDGRVSVVLPAKRQAILLLSQAGWAARRIAEHLKSDVRWVSRVRADYRRLGALDGAEEIARTLRKRVVPQAVENVAEMLEDEALRAKRPGLAYQMSKDALQAVPFRTGDRGNAGSANPGVVVNVVALPGISVEAMGPDVKRIEGKAEPTAGANKRPALKTEREEE